MTAPGTLPRSVVLVGNPNSGHVARGLERAQQALTREGLRIVETIHMHDLARLRAYAGPAVPPEQSAARPGLSVRGHPLAADRPLIVAAGGDGTVGAVANYLAYTDAVLGIIPLGTSNDVARSLRLPMGIEDAAHVLATGKVATVDLGSFFAQGEAPRYFAHAAAMGIDVKFAKLATQVTLRRRLGRFTYAVAAVLALRDRQPFRCELQMGGRALPLCLLHLSVINAPIFGGRFNLAIEGSDVDDRRLDVLAVEDAPLHHLLWATIPLLLRRRPHVGGVRLYHLQRLRVHIDEALDVSLDGEIAARIPGEFNLAPEALRVVTTHAFVDVDGSSQ